VHLCKRLPQSAVSGICVARLRREVETGATSAASSEAACAAKKQVRYASWSALVRSKRYEEAEEEVKFDH